MHARSWQVTTLLVLATGGAGIAALTSDAEPSQVGDLSAFDGEWLYVEDRTEGRPTEQHGPPMSAKFTLRVDEDAVVWLRPRRDEPITLDGSTLEVPESGKTSHHTGEWKDGVLHYEVKVVSDSDASKVTLIQREFRITAEGMLLRVVTGSRDSLALYRHPTDIPLPTPAQAEIDDLEWLARAWVGENGPSSIEERWSPPLGGGMLGVARTVRNDTMRSFEFLRIVERGRGLVYVAQPGGNAPTEFVLTELDGDYAVFDNPRHDYPQRIVYELLDEDTLTTSIGFIHGGSPRPSEYYAEDV